MARKQFIRIGLAIIATLALSFSNLATAWADEISDVCAPLGCPVQNTSVLANTLNNFTAPALTPPELPKQTVTYSTQTRGSINADFATFKTLANETLNDGRGWARMNVKFVEVESGGQFTLVLSEASQLPTFSSGCDATYSCAVGNYVIINQDRWQGATPSWNSAGGSLRDYRHMVINHEVGHWLGHGHENCPGAGQPAAVMQQQSINLQGCTFNPWPLTSELWSTRLGITL